MKTTELVRQIEIENMAREAAKASGIIKALDDALQYGKRDVKEYGGAFDAVQDVTDWLQSSLDRMADEMNEGKQ